MGTMITAEQAIDELSGTTCRGCGQEKKRRMTHCRSCYFLLPRPMRRALYKRVGEGYEEAYAASLAWLAEKGARTRQEPRCGTSRKDSRESTAEFPTDRQKPQTPGAPSLIDQNS